MKYHHSLEDVALLTGQGASLSWLDLLEPFYVRTWAEGVRQFGRPHHRVVFMLGGYETGEFLLQRPSRSMNGPPYETVNVCKLDAETLERLRDNEQGS